MESNMRDLAKANSHDRNQWGVGTMRHRMAMGDDVGQAFVELALALPIYVMLLLGSAEFGLLAYASIEVSNAARAGVAYGAQSAATAADLTGMATAATNDGSNVAGLGATATEFWSCSNAPSTQSSTPPTCTTGNHVLNYVQVNTTAAVSPPIQLPGLPLTFTLHGQAIMRVEQR
jgi:Flp pilus assembly protein TadG